MAYFTVATIALAVAFGAAALDPLLLGEFFYHPRALALVHLVTLGWITCSILGALYIVGPVALRVAFPARGRDWLAFACVSTGIAGMVAHFWLDSYAGMIWSAAMLLTGLAMVASFLLPPLFRAPIPAAVKLYPALAFANILAAGALGALVGLEKVGVVALPGFPLDDVYAHAHIAALGWATMMAIGIGYRLLPMQLPAAPYRGAGLAAPAILLQLGVIGLAATLILDSRWHWLFAALILAALATFSWHVLGMLRQRRPTPQGLQRPDLGMGHTIAAFAWLLIAAATGIAVLAMPSTARELGLVFVYGVAGLVGFLAQLVVGIGSRLLPMAAWMQAFVRSGFEPPSASQYDMQMRPLRALTLLAWNIGCAGLAVSLYLQHSAAIGWSAMTLFAAITLEAINRLLVSRYWLSK